MISDIGTSVVQLPVALAAAATFYLLATIIYRIFFHPLAKYPGPLIGKFSELAIYAAIFRKDRVPYFHDLIKTHGSPVRVATNQLVFSDEKSWNDIYGQSSNLLLKDPAFYGPFTVTGAVNALNATDRHHASRIRRLMTHGFAKATILQSEGMIMRRAQLLCDAIFEPNCSGPAVDIAPKIHEHYLDIISNLSFGRSFDCVSGSNPTAAHDVNEFLNYVPATAFFPLLKYMPIESLREGREGLERLKEFSRQAVVDFIERHNASSSKGETHLLKNLVEAVDPQTGTKLTMAELIENTILFLVAGEGTTAVTTIYTLWECSQKADVQAKLVQEIRGAFPPGTTPTYEVAQSLPYLNAVIQETLRLHGPLNVANPRISSGHTIAGHTIPKGVSVCTNAYSAARDPIAFPEPDTYIPDRWLASTPEMRSLSRPFSTGPRNCIGRHLAEIGLTLTLSKILQSYDIGPCDEMKAESMRVKDRGVLDPWDEKLLVTIYKADVET